jgi:hypothetical protein
MDEKPPLNLIAPETEVMIGAPDFQIPGMIAAVRILPENVIDYFVVWWSGRDRKSDWLDPFEIKVIPNGKFKSVTVGFNQ